MIILALIPGLRGSQHAQTFALVMGIARRAVGFIVEVLITPIYGIGLTLLYYDQRIRLEGYDIERMMEEAGMTASLNLLSGDSLIAPVAEEPRP